MIKKKFFSVLLVVAISQMIIGQNADNFVVDNYEPHTREGMPYRLMRPLEFNQNKKYPLILSLHGAGSKGTDNIKQIAKEKYNHYLADTKIRKAFPCYVLVPQSNGLWNELQLPLIKSIIKDLDSVDMTRVYILGHSAGGYGTYKFIHNDPHYFAAAAPSAGSGLATTEDFIEVSVIKNIPIWIFHGDKDPKCPYEKDRKVFEDMKKIDGNMKFTTWREDNHRVGLKMVTGSENGMTEISSDKCDPEPVFLKWLFKQKSKNI